MPHNPTERCTERSDPNDSSERIEPRNKTLLLMLNYASSMMLGHHQKLLYFVWDRGMHAFSTVVVLGMNSNHGLTAPCLS